MLAFLPNIFPTVSCFVFRRHHGCVSINISNDLAELGRMAETKVAFLNFNFFTSEEQFCP